MNKILSFVVPSYNCEKYLDKCLKSFLNKEVMDKFEVIIINDGSTDSTKDIANSYCEEYPDTFRTIYQENQGHGGALNTGCSIAKGKYIKAIDADDWVETKNLPKFISLLENCDSDVVLTHYYVRNILTGIIQKWKSYPNEFNKNYSMEEIMSNWKSFDRTLTYHGITYNTNFYKENSIKLSTHVFYEDNEFATIPCCYAKTIMPFDIFIYDYRIGDSNQSVSDKKQIEKISDAEKVIYRLSNEFSKLKISEENLGRDYFIMKAQSVLINYFTVVMLLNKNKKSGRKMGKKMMSNLNSTFPELYSIVKRKYIIFRLMNYLHINKKTWDKIQASTVYNFLRSNHKFD